MFKNITIYFSAVLFFILSGCTSSNNTNPLYKDASAPIEKRVEDLLGRMTLEEKIGQMSQLSTHVINNSKPGDSKALRFRAYIDTLKADSLIMQWHVGSFLAGFAIPAEDWVDFGMELQRIALEKTRLGIPIIYGNDNIHGANYVQNGTVFPQALGLACTFNDLLASEMGRITAIETADLGQPWNFAPVLDLGRNPYWPRLYESMGESPLLISNMGANYINALQNCQEALPYKVTACAKHFVGYGVPVSGYDRAPALIADQELYEYHLKSFKAAIDAGVKTFMINSGEVNGEAVHASQKYIHRILRQELGFKGVIVTDWADIMQLVGQHRVAKDEKEATKMALLAGIDMSMIASSTSFMTIVKELVTDGEIPLQVVDDACRRILRLKFELGLFENPYPSKKRINRIGSEENRLAALKAAEESIVLLQNDSVLPIQKDVKRILVVGPSTHSKRNICGAWTIEWGGAPEESFPARQLTVYTGLQKEFPNAIIDTLSDPLSQLALFNAKAKNADVIIMAVGEEPHAEGNGNINDLSLPKEQIEMIEAVQKTNKPNVILMISGRPRVISNISQKSNAIVWAGLPGFEGGEAIANILSGKVNPSGKLAFTYPKSPAHITPHNCKRHEKYDYAWQFGHGLSYTQFEYSNLVLSDTVIDKQGEIIVTVDVTNKGNRAGKETPMWFLRDEIRTITPSHGELINYQKIEIQPGETKTVTLKITPEMLSFPNDKGEIISEDGFFRIKIGELHQLFYFTLSGKKEYYKKLNESYLQQEV